jgi:Ca2+-binding RTX toxin-like protein
MVETGALRFSPDEETTMIIPGTSRNDVLFGTSGEDTLYGYAGDDQLFGGDADDHLWGGPGADLLYGGVGLDWANYDDAKAGVYVRLDTGFGYAGDAAGDVLIEIECLSGSSYADILVGNDGINFINGNFGDDWIFGLGGVDVLHGGDGNDHIWGGAARDYIYGDAGFDYVRYDDATEGVDVRLDEPPPLFPWAPGGGWGGADALADAIWSAEGLVGSQFADHLAGANLGASADNVLIGLGGDDELIGKGGDDRLFGGDGADYLDGGTGFDYAQYDDAPSGVWVSLATGVGYTGAATHDLLIGVEGLVGSNFDDLLIGDAASNVLVGGSGNDVLEGGQGGDTLDGGAGFDVATYENAASSVTVDLFFARGTVGEAFGDVLISIEGLTGSSYADTLTGDAVDNVLRGGAGADTLTGAFGNDQFVFERNDLLAERDIITDFGVAVGDNDMLVFHGIAAGDIALTDEPTGDVRISVLDPAFGGDILVRAITVAELSGHLLFA